MVAAYVAYKSVFLGQFRHILHTGLPATSGIRLYQRNGDFAVFGPFPSNRDQFTYPNCGNMLACARLTKAVQYAIPTQLEKLRKVSGEVFGNMPTLQGSTMYLRRPLRQISSTTIIQRCSALATEENFSFSSNIILTLSLMDQIIDSGYNMWYKICSHSNLIYKFYEEKE